MADDKKKSHYPQAYEVWAGRPEGVPPDYGKCCMAVQARYEWIPRQCSRRSGYGEDGAFCKVHADRLKIEPDYKPKMA